MVKTCKIVSSTPLRGTLIKESEPGGNQYISAAGASLGQSAVAMRCYKCRMMIVWPEEQFSRVHDTAAQHRRLPPPWRRLATLPRLLSCVAAAPEPDRAWNEPSRSLKLYNHGEKGSPWLKVATSCYCFHIVHFQTSQRFVWSSRTRPHLNLMAATRMASHRHTSRQQHLIMRHVSEQSIHNRMTFFPLSSARKAPGRLPVHVACFHVPWQFPEITF